MRELEEEEQKVKLFGGREDDARGKGYKLSFDDWLGVIIGGTRQKGENGPLLDGGGRLVRKERA